MDSRGLIWSRTMKGPLLGAQSQLCTSCRVCGAMGRHQPSTVSAAPCQRASFSVLPAYGPPHTTFTLKQGENISVFRTDLPKRGFQAVEAVSQACPPTTPHHEEAWPAVAGRGPPTGHLGKCLTQSLASLTRLMILPSLSGVSAQKAELAVLEWQGEAVSSRSHRIIPRDHGLSFIVIFSNSDKPGWRSDSRCADSIPDLNTTSAADQYPGIRGV